jgi:uncharacterized membrane protein YfcA
MFGEFIEPDTPPVIFWSFVALAILVQGISKSGFAGGVGILAIPLMMLVMPVDRAVAVFLPLLILLDLNAIYHHRSNKIWRKVLEIYFPACIGILVGSTVWWWIGQEGVEHYAVSIKRFVGVIAVLFASYVFSRERAVAWASRLHLGRKTACMIGLTSGFTSTIAHAAGPIVSFYFFAQGMGKSFYVGTTAWTFTLINLTKLPFYIGVGLIRSDVLVFDLLLIGLIPIGSFLGKWMHDRFSEQHFNRVIMVLVLVAGFQLISNVNFVLLALTHLLELCKGQ